MVTTYINNKLPQLSWLAKINKDTLTLIVQHGENVECSDDGIIEGIWSGRFEEKNPFNAYNFFGSAIFKNKSHIKVLPSSAITERILIGHDKENYFISNSLVVILALTESKLDPRENYKVQADSLYKGTINYEKDIPIISDKLSKLEQYYRHPISIDSNGITVGENPNNVVFSCFEDYKEKIQSELNLLFENAHSNQRKRKINALSTVSTGYDSAATSALCSEFNIKSTYTKKYSNASLIKKLLTGNALDDGSKIASILNLEVKYLDIKDSEIGTDELFFLSATASEPEIVFYKLCKDVKESSKLAMVFTGYHGDKLWERNVPIKYLTNDIIRGDMSGLNLSEARLYFGFFNIPIPLMFAENICQINKISNSKEMYPWKLDNSYDRPIPRRLLEEKNVPRDFFGIHKKAVISYYSLPKSKQLKKTFMKYLKEEYHISAYRITGTQIFDRLRYHYLMLNYLILMKFSSFTKLEVQKPLNTNSLDLPLKLHIWSCNTLAQNIAKEISI